MDEHGGLLPPASYGAVDAHSETADAHYGDDEARIAMAQSEREKEGHADDHRRKAESRRTVCVSRGMGLAGVMVIVGAVGYMNPDLMNHAQDVLGDMVRACAWWRVRGTALLAQNGLGCGVRAASTDSTHHPHLHSPTPTRAHGAQCRPPAHLTHLPIHPIRPPRSIRLRQRESSTVEVVESSSLSFGCSNEYPVPGSLQFYANW